MPRHVTYHTISKYRKPAFHSAVGLTVSPSQQQALTEDTGATAFHLGSSKKLTLSDLTQRILKAKLLN